MICPRCNTALAISNTHGIEIDHCPNCRGVWLDRGELEKMIERSSQYGMPHTESNHHYDHHDNHHDKHQSYGQHGYGHSKHKKGFFSELFDF